MTEQQPKPRRRIMLMPYRNDAPVDLLALANGMLNVPRHEQAIEFYSAYTGRPPIIDQIARVRVEG